MRWSGVVSGNPCSAPKARGSGYTSWPHFLQWSQSVTLREAMCARCTRRQGSSAGLIQPPATPAFPARLFRTTVLLNLVPAAAVRQGTSASPNRHHACFSRPLRSEARSERAYYEACTLHERLGFYFHDHWRRPHFEPCDGAIRLRSSLWWGGRTQLHRGVCLRHTGSIVQRGYASGDLHHSTGSMHEGIQAGLRLRRGDLHERLRTLSSSGAHGSRRRVH